MKKIPATKLSRLASTLALGYVLVNLLAAGHFACSTGESSRAKAASGGRTAASGPGGSKALGGAPASSKVGGSQGQGGSRPAVGAGGSGPTGGTPAASGGTIGSGNSAGGAASTSSATGGSNATTGGSNATTGGAPNAAGGTQSSSGGSLTGISTEANLKVAFIGDTDAGTNFKNVLNLVKSEGATGLVVEGDMSYSENPTTWWSDLESVLGTSYPVFISRGNHDDSTWSGYLAKAAAHLDGAVREAGAHDANYKTTWRGLTVVSIKLGDTAQEIEPFLKDDPHVWKICNWHQNQKTMQIGGKGDEMGWEVYETCRQLGAIIQTGHEHSYERTKTLVNMAQQTVDSTCNSATNLCVSPGRTFVNVVGLGGNSVRPQLLCLPATPPYGCKGEWAFIYTSNQNATYGAQFITFNAGDPHKATAYFKNVNNSVVDTFTITQGP